MGLTLLFQTLLFQQHQRLLLLVTLLPLEAEDGLDVGLVVLIEENRFGQPSSFSIFIRYFYRVISYSGKKWFYVCFCLFCIVLV